MRGEIVLDISTTPLKIPLMILEFRTSNVSGGTQLEAGKNSSKVNLSFCMDDP